MRIKLDGSRWWWWCWLLHNGSRIGSYRKSVAAVVLESNSSLIIHKARGMSRPSKVIIYMSSVRSCMFVCLCVSVYIRHIENANGLLALNTV